MLVYRVGRMETPKHLQGCQLARCHGDQHDYLALSHHADLLPPASAEWVACKGFDVALVGDLDPSEWKRPIKWSVPVIVDDGSGTLWPLPLLLDPQGMPLVDLRIVMDEKGELQRAPIDARQQMALESAAWARSQIMEHGDLHESDDAELTKAALSILSACYYMSAEVIGRLGLMTVIARRELLRTAAGVFHGDDGK